MIRDPVAPEGGGSDRAAESKEPLPGEGAGAATERVRVLDSAALPEGGTAVVSVGGRDVALVRVEGRVYALDNTCPHRGGPLGEGDLMGNEITCPWHLWGFDIASGACTGDASICVPVYEVRVENDRVLVRIE